MEAADIDNLVTQVAEHLDGFRPLIRPGHPAYLIGPDETRLVVYPLWRQAGRVIVLGVYPDGSGGLFPDLRRHQVTVTSSRGAEYVARKIARRLLPGYLRDLAACRERLRGRTTENAARDDLVETLRTLLPGATVNEKQRETVVRWRLGAASGSFAVYGEGASTSIEVRMADRELTERVAYAIHERFS
ncbi:hypothetical protein [Microtetraspora sp. NBRC 16547]|uniref:hypothetical protein n=1 Tax=Microtetraspora sp. NBRC 16547 TaxID=3030993 RepID=UPI0024A39DE0|nr:hypothetical protein [Microtetraspora sp. NBRC 16547]GLW98254.1 hypothetical protein Misp02_23410 [Microtetraspora sp. NBRC 16547]